LGKRESALDLLSPFERRHGSASHSNLNQRNDYGGVLGATGGLGYLNEFAESLAILTGFLLERSSSFWRKIDRGLSSCGCGPWCRELLIGSILRKKRTVLLKQRSDEPRAAPKQGGPVG